MSAMTEEEATGMWCPFARPRPDYLQSSASNRDQSGQVVDRSMCIASRCMAWRWIVRFGTSPDNPADCAILPSTHGYCGLAGRPE